MATWHGLQVPHLTPGTSRWRPPPRHRVARIAAGADHHFRAIQMPYSVMPPGCPHAASQEVSGKLISALEAARELGLTASPARPWVKDMPSMSRSWSNCGNLPGDAAACPMLRLAASTPGLGKRVDWNARTAHVDEGWRLPGCR